MILSHGNGHSLSYIFIKWFDLSVIHGRSMDKENGEWRKRSLCSVILSLLYLSGIRMCL
jgi:hypothetical protein